MLKVGNKSRWTLNKDVFRTFLPQFIHLLLILVPYLALYFTGMYFCNFPYSIPCILGIISGKPGAAVHQPGALTTELRRTLRAKPHPRELRRILNELRSALLWIRDILVRIRIRPLTKGSGSGSGSCFFVLDLQDANKKLLFWLITVLFEGTRNIYIIFLR